MRLLFATSIKTWGGGEEWMLASAAGLRARGHDVALAGRPGSAIVSRALRAGVPVVAARFAADLDVVSFARVFHACRARRTEALVANMDRVLRVAGPAARLAGVRVVLPRRGSEFPLKAGPLYRWTYRRVATGVLVNSRATERSLLEGVPWRPAGRVRVLPNGVDLARIDAARPREETRRSLGLPQDAAVLLVVGELTTRKNPALLLDAAARLRGEGLLPWLLFAGEGTERDGLERRAAALGLADRTRLLGFRADVADLLAAADVLVHPSRVEGFGYAVAEAMAAGRPVVATDASSLPEIVVHGETGLLFAPDDDARLAAAIATYLRDPERRARDGARGRARARAEFSLERRLRELEAILEEEIAGAAARPGP
jgi:glycosyltransferase involved in cell wall biosynthesis